jgi:hypothetical protein
MEVCILKNTMGITWNNELKFHLNITHFWEKVHMLNILLQGIFDDERYES